MAKLSLYKRYHLLNVSLDNRVSFSSALSESRRLFLQSLSLVDRRSLASAVSEPRQFFVACEDCAARLALSLPRCLDNRVSSSSAFSEARLIFLRYLSLVHCTSCRIQMLRVLLLNWNYGMCSARYIYTYIYIYRKIAASCTTRLARSRSPITVWLSKLSHISPKEEINQEFLLIII